MMEDPDFQEKMKKMAESQHFQASMKKTQDMMNDPEKVKELEAKVAKSIEDGEEQLKITDAQSADAKATEKEDKPATLSKSQKSRRRKAANKKKEDTESDDNAPQSS
eukprot:scaffold25925_cov59-Attheya_sp.AAC.7